MDSKIYIMQGGKNNLETEVKLENFHYLISGLNIKIY